ADASTRGIRAVVAPRDLKAAGDGGVLAVLHGLDPSAGDPERHLVFALARGRAGMATDALPVVDDESVVHDVLTAGEPGHTRTAGGESQNGRCGACSPAPVGPTASPANT